MTTEAGAPRRGWLWPALVGSLMINLLVAGALAGAFLTGRGGHGWHGREHKGVTGFVEQLPDARRRELKVILDARLAELEPLWAEMKDARRTVMEVVGAEPFDRAKLDAVLARLNQTDARVRDARSRKFAEVIAAMTADERRAFREWRQKMRHGRRPRDGGDGDDETQKKK